MFLGISYPKSPRKNIKLGLFFLTFSITFSPSSLARKFPNKTTFFSLSLRFDGNTLSSSAKLE